MRNDTFHPVKFNLPYKCHRVYNIPGLKKYSLLVQDIYSILLDHFQSSPRYESKDNCYATLVSMENLQNHYHLSAFAIDNLLNKLQKAGYINKVNRKDKSKIMIELPKLTSRIKAVVNYLKNCKQ